MCICCLASSGVRVFPGREVQEVKSEATVCCQSGLCRGQDGSAIVVVWLLVDALRARTNNTVDCSLEHLASWPFVTARESANLHGPATSMRPAALEEAQVDLGYDMHCESTAYGVTCLSECVRVDLSKIILSIRGFTSHGSLSSKHFRRLDRT